MIRHMTKMAAMADQIKRGRGRPPKPEGPLSAADRQRFYAASRGRDMALVAFALRQALEGSKTQSKAFVTEYCGTPSGQRLRRGLARLLADDPETMAFFDSLIPSGDEK